MRCALLLAACTAVFPVTTAHAAPAVMFYKQIAPIIFKNCAPCHRPGESGPFSLLTYDDVKRRATQIAAVTKRRYMPPWLAEPGYGDFVEERRRSDAQIQLIQGWAKQGAPAGPITDPPAGPPFNSEGPPATPAPGARVQRRDQPLWQGPQRRWKSMTQR